MSQDTKEHERKWLATLVPESVYKNLKVHVIKQGYVAVTPKSSVRVRSIELDGVHFFYLTYKSGRGVTRDEYEVVIDGEVFDQLWLKTDTRLEKRRYVWADGGCRFDLDFYDGPLAGLVTVEVESPIPEFVRRFSALDWFGMELTNDPAYTNARLAANGLPMYKKGQTCPHCKHRTPVMFGGKGDQVCEHCRRSWDWPIDDK